MLVRIYLITNEVTGKYYVGQTSCGIEKRFRDHISSANTGCKRGCVYLQRAMQKYGIENFSTQELASADSSEQGDALETLWIILLDARNPDVGYNLSTGGNSTRGIKWNEKSKDELSKRMLGNTRGLGRVVTEEVRNKISNSLMGHEQKPNSGSFTKGLVPWNKGGTFSEETKRKMSESRKGRIPWNKGTKGIMIAWNKGLKKEIAHVNANS
jgi:group I intron endonuclease